MRAFTRERKAGTHTCSLSHTHTHTYTHRWEQKKGLRFFTGERKAPANMASVLAGPTHSPTVSSRGLAEAALRRASSSNLNLRPSDSERLKLLFHDFRLKPDEKAGAASSQRESAASDGDLTQLPANLATARASAGGTGAAGRILARLEKLPGIGRTSTNATTSISSHALPLSRTTSLAAAAVGSNGGGSAGGGGGGVLRARGATPSKPSTPGGLIGRSQSWSVSQLATLVPLELERSGISSSSSVMPLSAGGPVPLQACPTAPQRLKSIAVRRPGVP